jgi:hypothetical protein
MIGRRQWAAVGAAVGLALLAPTAALAVWTTQLIDGAGATAGCPARTTHPIGEQVELLADNGGQRPGRISDRREGVRLTYQRAAGRRVVA